MDFCLCGGFAKATAKTKLLQDPKKRTHPPDAGACVRFFDYRDFAFIPEILRG